MAKDYFDRNDIKVIYSNARKFGLTNDIWKLREFSLKQLAIENVFFCSAFFRKQDWGRVGGYDELAAVVLHLSQSQEFCNSIVKACRKRASHFDITKMIKEHFTLYHNLLKDAKK